MNKNLKRIIALALVFGTVSAVAPATSVNLLTTKAYASTDENDDTTLNSLELKTSSDSTINLYSSDNYNKDDKVDPDDVTDDVTYYAKTSSSKISIDTKGPSTKYVKVFKGTSKSTKGKSITSDIDLSSGTTVLTVKVYNNKPDSDVTYDDGDVANEYKIKVKYTGSDSTTDDSSADDYDDIYLDKLSVDSESISLSESKIAYTYNVASNVNKVTIKAAPQSDSDIVRVNGSKVYENDSYKTDVSLNAGENKIEIKVEDEDNNDDRVYTLKITKAATAATATSTATSIPSTATTVVTTTVKANQWVQQTNGIWQYNDALGNPLKNSWVKNYYVDANGNMATGWLSTGGKWYYFGTSGAMSTGWILDAGKYYYLNADGTMASSVTISGYKLGTDGAWIR